MKTNYFTAPRTLLRTRPRGRNSYLDGERLSLFLSLARPSLRRFPSSAAFFCLRQKQREAAHRFVHILFRGGGKRGAHVRRRGGIRGKERSARHEQDFSVERPDLSKVLK